MTDLRKAAEMALDALHNIDQSNNGDAIEALRQALAQPEQEPVAWITDGGKGELGWRKTTEKDIPLYTAPPKREWVGLSSLDKTFLRTAYAQLRPLYHDKKEDVSVAAEVVTDWDGFFAAIDAKLKEKNNG